MSDAAEAASKPSTESATQQKVKRGARNAFPRVVLPKVIPLLQAIWDEGRGDKVRMTRAFERLGRSHASGTSKTLIAAANSGYQLIEGNASSTHLELTDLARKIVDPNLSPEREDGIQDALFSSDVFNLVYERYLDRALPSDQVVSDFIKSETALSDEDSKACWAVIAENMRFAGLLVKEGNSDVIVARPQAHLAVSSVEQLDNPPEPKTQTAGEQTVSPVVTSKNPVLPPRAEFHFNVQIHLPNDATPEVYDSIFASIAKNLLQRQD